MTKAEKINEVIVMSRGASREKNKKKLERNLKKVKLNLTKAKEDEVDKLYSDMKEKGAEAYLDEQSAKYKNKK